MYSTHGRVASGNGSNISRRRPSIYDRVLQDSTWGIRSENPDRLQPREGVRGYAATRLSRRRPSIYDRVLQDSTWGIRSENPDRLQPRDGVSGYARVSTCALHVYFPLHHRNATQFTNTMIDSPGFGQA